MKHCFCKRRVQKQFENVFSLDTRAASKNFNEDRHQLKIERANFQLPHTMELIL